MRATMPLLTSVALAVTLALPTAAMSKKPPQLPPSQETAKQALETSPRHGEFVDVRVPGGDAPIRTWVVYPERKDKAGVVLIIHEIYGLSDWIRGVADAFAAAGFVAVAPDLISGMGPGGGGTDSVASRDDVVKLVRALTPEQTEQRLDAVRAYGATLPASNGKVATVGFCWGGARSFAYAASDVPPDGAVVYYGSSPDSLALLRVKAPVLGHYGADDARVNATIPPAKAALDKAGRKYDVHIYDGAGHGFLRQQEDRNGANRKATEQAWPRTIDFMKKTLD
jgi:carboxymethylenebutenolidase